MIHHYGRRVMLVADEESDRRSGKIEWFCSECGHRYEQAAIPDRPSRIGDYAGLTELSTATSCPNVNCHQRGCGVGSVGVQSPVVSGVVCVVGSCARLEKDDGG